MQVPSRRECFVLMQAVSMPSHIRRHSCRVAEVATTIGGHLNKDGGKLDMATLEAGALLHDIAKGICLETGCNHARVGSEMLTQWGYDNLAPIVSGHIFIKEDDLRRPLTESLIVNYADKRVKHDQIVSLSVRFQDLMERYGKTPARQEKMEAKFKLYTRLEQRLFARLDIQPLDLINLAQENLTCC